MAQPREFTDLDGGDETRRFGQTVGLPHAQDTGGLNDVAPGQAVSVDANGNIKQAEGGEVVIGVLSQYQVYGADNTIKQDRDATVRAKGAVKARVVAGVAPGDALDAPATAATDPDPAGVLSPTNADATSNAVAVSPAWSETDDAGNTVNYAEVILL